jgi:serine/threonine protein kinase/Flp pilus assembly protein TadD
MTEDAKDKTLSIEIYAPGTAVAHYTLRSVIGTGATGVVYIAEDRDLDRKVALKFLFKELSANAEWRARFQREARTAARLNHPNIITIHDIGDFEGQPFIAMEYIEGGSLDDYIEDRRLPIEETLELAIQIADGLSEAHAQGLVHRDIKPSNILVTLRGRAKIVDFGLAADITAASGSASHLLVGTAGYISPEQLEGKPADARSDLFSFGCVLYKILAGRNAFPGRNLGEIGRAVLESEPRSVTEYAPYVPAEVARIVDRLLKKKSDLRYQKAEDVRSELRYALEAFVSGRLQCAGRVREFSRSIAVLPFANLSGDKDQDHFCDGMAEEIINALAKVRDLRIAARTSTLAFKNSTEDAREIGRKLHVETLLEGSVRRAGDRLRANVQLIDVATGYHLWSEQYDQKVEDIFAIQDEIAQNVVRALKPVLSENEVEGLVKKATHDSQAYDLYLRGLRFYHQGLRRSFFFARQMFAKAIEVDPDYARAHAGLAATCAMLIHFYGESTDTHIAEADKASQRALELDPNLGPAHTARGFTLWLMNRFDEAKVEFETAMRLDPADPQTPYLYGRACFQRGDMIEAARLFEEACRGSENHEARYFAAQAHAALGHTETANAAYRLAHRAVEKHVELNPDDARAFTMGAVSLCRLGERQAGLEWAERAVAIDPNDPGIQYNVACLFALEGEEERAIDFLEAAVKAGFAHRDWVMKDPDLDSLRDNPRFKSLKWRE